MMKAWFGVVLVLGLASAAAADLTLVGVPIEPIGVGDTVTITVANSRNGAYAGWLEIGTPDVATFETAPKFTEAGDPGGASLMKYWPQYGAWYEFTVVSFPPNPAVEAGDHIVVRIVGLSAGTTNLNLYDSDGVTLLDRCSIAVVPEPTTIALLGLGGLLLRRRK